MEERISTCEKVLNFSLKSKYALGLINKKRLTEFSHLKPLQCKSLKLAIEKDVVVVLPTGYGKSLIFEVLPYLNDTKVVIVCPLNAIIYEQVQKFGEDAICIENNLLKNEEAKLSKFVSGNVKYVIGHPEHILKKEITDILRNNNWNNVSHIIIDEAHCIVQWGHDFRPEYKNLVKLRSIFPNAKIIAMTATATVKMQEEIGQNLCLRNVGIVSTNVVRNNTKISVARRLPITGGKYSAEESFHQVLETYLENLCTDPSSFEKTIIYTKLKWCGHGYQYVHHHAREKENFDDIMDSVSQFHAPCTELMKKEIVDDMGDTKGKIKLLFATEAYGMGADAPDVRQIVHIGPPTSLETYLQEIGRAGRDGKQSTAVLYFNNNDIGSNAVIKPEVREFCLLQSCRRQYLCNHFGFQFIESDIMHNCCDVCASKCTCDCCLVRVLDECSIVEVNQGDKVSAKKLKQLLLSYFQAENQCFVNEPNSTLYTGLSECLIDEICKAHTTFGSVEVICSKFPYLQKHYVENIFTIISQVQDESNKA